MVVGKMKSSIEKYLKEIGEIKLLSADEEIELAKRIKQNDHQALQKLVLSNLRFVVSVAKSYHNTGLSLEDLVDEGNLGLIRAAHSYDETRGFKFISYAVWWIRQSILYAIAEKARMIRLPQNRVADLTKIGKISDQLEQEFERVPTDEEIANTLDIDPEKISKSVEKKNQCLSIDKPFQADKNNRLLDVIENQNEMKPDYRVMRQSLKEEVESMVDALPNRESRILKLYFGLDGEKPHTLEQIGTMHKLTRERVRQIKDKSLGRLRHKSRSRILRQYLD